MMIMRVVRLQLPPQRLYRIKKIWKNKQTNKQTNACPCAVRKGGRCGCAHKPAMYRYPYVFAFASVCVNANVAHPLEQYY